MDDYTKNEREDIFSRPVRAGKRTYFFDVKETRNQEYYLTITESKKQFPTDGKPYFEKHKIFLYKEDFDKFSEAFQDVIDFIKEKQPYEPRSYNDDYKKDKDTEGNEFTDINFEDLSK